MVATKAAKPAAGAGKKDRTNKQLTTGVYRYSKNVMDRKKAVWKFVKKTTAKAVKPKKAVTVEKTIGGDKNGGKRVVLLKKTPNYYPTADAIRKNYIKSKKQHNVYTRPTLTPGTICIVLAGRHAGRRVVLLKVLKSGLALVTGPFALNACPLRRVHQNFLIATSTKIDISTVEVPEKINDDYFKRKREKRAKKEEGEIFAKKAEKYAPSEERKADQKALDTKILAVLKKHPEGKLLKIYLKSMFGLKTSQFPHRMKF
uniref:60S ribosomal protein L6 n=1 Tax=Anthurium amnicola TaxID=1678845 RepID=A0A1D1Y9V4_9ARAE